MALSSWFFQNAGDVDRAHDDWEAGGDVVSLYTDSLEGETVSATVWRTDSADGSTELVGAGCHGNGHPGPGKAGGP